MAKLKWEDLVAEEPHGFVAEFYRASNAFSGDIARFPQGNMRRGMNDAKARAGEQHARIASVA